MNGERHACDGEREFAARCEPFEPAGNREHECGCDAQAQCGDGERPGAGQGVAGEDCGSPDRNLRCEQTNVRQRR